MISAKEVRRMPSNADEFFENLLENQLKEIENLIISERKHGKNSVTIQIQKPYKGLDRGIKIYAKTLKELISKGFKISNIRDHECSFYIGYKLIDVSW